MKDISYSVETPHSSEKTVSEVETLGDVKVEFDTPKHQIPWGIIISIILFIIALLACAYFYFQTIEYTINSYDECVAVGNPVQEKYPAVCVTHAGRHFQQPLPSGIPVASEIPILSPDPKIATSSGANYECPENEWIDCMPSPDVDKSATCSPEALNWFHTHCPSFQGAAY